MPPRPKALPVMWTMAGHEGRGWVSKASSPPLAGLLANAIQVHAGPSEDWANLEKWPVSEQRWQKLCLPSSSATWGQRQELLLHLFTSGQTSGLPPPGQEVPGGTGQQRIPGLDSHLFLGDLRQGTVPCLQGAPAGTAPVRSLLPSVPPALG